MEIFKMLIGLFKPNSIHHTPMNCEVCNKLVCDLEKQRIANMSQEEMEVEFHNMIGASHNFAKAFEDLISDDNITTKG